MDYSLGTQYGDLHSPARLYLKLKTNLNDGTKRTFYMFALCFQIFVEKTGRQKMY